jgi:uncharacterized protein DUF3969
MDDKLTSKEAYAEQILWLRAKDGDEVQRLVAVAALGMCRALATGALSPAYACHRLFGPALLARLDQLDTHSALRHAIHMATELEDVADLIPDKLASAIADVEAELLKALADLDPSDLAGEKWLVRAP